MPLEGQINPAVVKHLRAAAPSLLGPNALSCHLCLESVDLPPAGERTVEGTGWLVAGIQGGLAYCIGAQKAVDIAPGEIVVIPPRARISIRASQLGGARLLTFTFCPELLGCFLTIGERRHYASLSEGARQMFFHFPTGHPGSAQFALLAGAGARENRLLDRCRMLSIVAELFPYHSIQTQQASPAAACAPRRFTELMDTLSESDILNQSSAELARSCGCSLRHFNRLFQERFGVSVRARQTILRLEMARELLLQTDAKIVDLAFDCGYRHLGLFNSMFKKHFGVTPSELRRGGGGGGSVKSNRFVPSLLLCLAVLLGSADVQSAEPPRAREAAPPPAATAGSTNGPVFAVRGYDVEGNTILPVGVLTKILAAHLGTSASFEVIRQALGELQLAYRARGYVTVSVALPRQQLTNGIVKVRVTEGKLAEIKVVNARYFSSNNVMRLLPSVRTNTLLNSLVLQQELDRANQSRDRQIYPEIGPGPDPGTTSLRLKVKDQLPLHGRVEVNNYSTPTTPELRVNTAIDYDNLWQMDQQVGAQYAFSPLDFKEKSLGSALYDEPLVANYSAFYRIPLAGLGPPPERKIAAGDFGYDEVTKRFRPPPLEGGPDLLIYASRSDSDTGNLLASDTVLSTSVTNNGNPNSFSAETKVFNETILVNEDIGARFSEPIPRFFGIASTLSAGLDCKVYQSTTTQTSVTEASIAGQTLATAQAPRTLSAHVDYLPLAVAWTAQRPDPHGVMSFNLNNSANFAGLLSTENDFRQAAGSARADGNYYVVDSGLSREQKLPGGWSLRLSADGQWANEPLITNERFGLGGNAGVRGYRDGQEYGDTGWRMIFEPHTQMTKFGLVAGKLPVSARFSVFTDYGRVYYLDPAAGSPSAISLWGVGCGASGTIGDHVDYRIAYGAPLLSTPTVKQGQGRISFLVGLQF